MIILKTFIFAWMQNVSLTITGNDKYITFLELIIGSNHLMTAASVEQNCIFMFLMHRSFKVMSSIASLLTSLLTSKNSTEDQS